MRVVDFSTVVMMMLCFGDFTPMTICRCLIEVTEAIAGFVLLAMLTSTLYRRFSS